MMIEDEVLDTLTLCINLKDYKNTEFIGLTKGKDLTHFTIQLDNTFPRPKTLRTLAHELVHVKQFHLQQLGLQQLVKEGVAHTLWNGKLVDETKSSHWDYPWEIEANGREEGLLERYQIFIKTYAVNFNSKQRKPSK